MWERGFDDFEENITRRAAISKAGKIAIAVGVIAVAGGVIYATTTLTAPGSVKTSIKVGATLALSGPLKPVIEEVQKPIYEIWRDQVNGQGGIFVRELNRRLPVEMIIYDDAGDTSKVPILYEKLIIEDKVDFVLPPWGTAWHVAAIPITEKYGKIMITNSEGADIRKLGTRTNYTFWTGSWRPDRISLALINFLNKYRSEHAINNVAVAVAQTDFGIDVSNYAVPLLEKNGYKIVYRTEYPLDIKDSGPIIAKLTETKADAFLVFSYPEDSLLIANGLLRGTYAPKVVWFLLGPNFPFFINALGSRMEGIFGIITTSNSLGGKYVDEWSRVLKEKYGLQFDYGEHPPQIASVQILQQAIEKAGTLDQQKVRQTLLSEEFDTITGKIRFKEEKEGIIATNEPLIAQWQNNRWVVVYPEKYKEGDAKLPYKIP
jgi:branched-chain amino acid transport system substrate-binding protein